ncbi:hypothetical protein GB937_010211, partial [Aspergillus fischeri]
MVSGSASTSASSVSLPPFDPETLTPSAYRTAPFPLPFTSDPDPPLNSEEDTCEYNGHFTFQKAETGSTWGGSSAPPAPSTPDEAPAPRDDQTIRILQYNVQTSLDNGMAPLLRDPRIRDYAVITIQEPWVNTYGDAPLTHFPREAADHFHIVWPAAMQGTPRVCTYVRTTLHWQVTFMSAHVISTAIQPAPSKPWIVVHNIYNPPQTTANEGVADLIQALEAADQQQRASGEPMEHIMVGDFNIHDTLRAGTRRLPRAQHNSDRAEALKQIIEQRPLELATPVGLITRPTPITARPTSDPSTFNSDPDDTGPGALSTEERAAGTTIDLTFVSWGLTDRANVPGSESRSGGRPTCAGRPRASR